MKLSDILKTKRQKIGILYYLVTYSQYHEILHGTKVLCEINDSLFLIIVRAYRLILNQSGRAYLNCIKIWKE